ncbi:MAG: tetratricopeptide repeat protein [Pseudomonadota bacterium]|nr:tetratricopeptide repeat protein [Pseudomonadota bacterium]
MSARFIRPALVGFALALGALSLAPAQVFAIGAESVEQPAAAKSKWDEKFGELGDGYKKAVELAEAGKYAEAIDALKALNKPEDPRVLNYLGYSTRKMGKPEDALVFYDKAIAIEPDFAPAREYRGEAYIQLGKIDKAKAELVEIERICGNKTCESYVDLAAALAAAPKS